MRSVGDYMPGIEQRHRYDDIIMGFYGKAFDNGFPANQNLGRSGRYRS